MYPRIHERLAMDKPKLPADKPEFDSSTATEMLAVAAMKMQTLLKAKQDAVNASSSREFAMRCVRGLESTINQLFDIGASSQEVLSHLLEALPTIPVDDLSHALKNLRTLRSMRMRNQKPRAAISEDITTPQSAVHEQAAKHPKKKAPLPATKTSAQTTNAAPQQPAGSPHPDRSHLPADWPAWADGSDRMPHESDEDYRFRKEIEGPPEARQKFIGEH